MKKIYWIILFAVVILQNCKKTEDLVVPAPTPTPTVTEYYLVVYRKANVGGNSITVYLDGKDVGKITKTVTVNPNCSETVNGWVKVKIENKSYKVTAFGEDGQGWEANLVVDGKTCNGLTIQ